MLATERLMQRAQRGARGHLALETVDSDELFQIREELNGDRHGGGTIAGSPPVGTPNLSLRRCPCVIGVASRERLGKVRAVNDPHLGSLVTCRWSRPARCSRDLAVAVSCLVTLLSSPAVSAQALRLVVTGDNLSAEYDSITGVPGVADPTEYGAISVPGYESMSWVEVLGRLRGSQINLGTFDSNRLGWGCLRFAGYEFNFAVPGFTAGQFEQVVNSSFLTDPQLFLYRQQLAGVLQGQGDAAVIWLGANEFRANATAATVAANNAIAVLAAARGVPVAGIFPDPHRLVLGETVWIGPVNLYPGREADNHPRYQFTRDGLHPNTCLQSSIARRIIDTFNQAYTTAIPAITDAEVRYLIGVDPRQTYLDWVAANSVSAAAVGDDGDGDGFVNLAEFVFDLDPRSASMGPMNIAATGGPAQVRFHPNPDRQRVVDVVAEWGIALGTWAPVPLGNLTPAPDGEITIALPGGAPSRFVRLQISLTPFN